MNRELKVFLIIAIPMVFINCANPLNQATSDRYAEDCARAEQHGNMEVAAEACYRAYMNVEWGNLGPELRSERLYNFGRVLRKAGRYEDAAEALTRALEEERNLTGSASVKSGRRMAELAATYYLLDEIDKGVPLVDALIPMTEQYSQPEKEFIASLLYFYSKHLEATDADKAERYISKMHELGYNAEHFDE